MVVVAVVVVEVVVMVVAVVVVALVVGWKQWDLKCGVVKALAVKMMG